MDAADAKPGGYRGIGHRPILAEVLQRFRQVVDNPQRPLLPQTCGGVFGTE